MCSVNRLLCVEFAEQLGKARKLGTFKQYIVGRSSEATFADAFEKQEAILRYLGGFDPNGENILSTHKQEAAKKCNSTIAEVENALAKYTWAKEAQKKVEKLKEEGKPMPTNMAEVQKLMGNTPMDIAQANMAKSGQISRNALCPCGSKKRYKKFNFRDNGARLKKTVSSVYDFCSENRGLVNNLCMLALEPVIGLFGISVLPYKPAQFFLLVQCSNRIFADFYLFILFFVEGVVERIEGHVKFIIKKLRITIGIEQQK
ncbi:hypothetical protein LIER_27375 [Lithospermum erythrorhizon]|uniref:Uncharacterized protein n=1 Tax=Lithospermum erythrorhizon TaxID=34254 RepID=A0AAV3RBS8_LITER